PGMAHGKILRSLYAHAKVVRVDASKAENFPGVYGVITRDDQKRFGMFGAAYKDQTIVAVDKARYVGDPVAVGAAVEDGDAGGEGPAGEDGLVQIKVDFEERPAVTSIDEALAAGAPLVHESSAAGGDIMGQHYEVPKEFVGTNLCYRFSYANGGVNAGFKKAD